MLNEPSLVEIACDEVRRVLGEYLDFDLTPELRAQIDHHLTNCQHCTAIYDGVRNIVGLVGSHGAIELPAGFSRRLRSRLGSK